MKRYFIMREVTKTEMETLAEVFNEMPPLIDDCLSAESFPVGNGDTVLIGINDESETKVSVYLDTVRLP